MSTSLDSNTGRSPAIIVTADDGQLTGTIIGSTLLSKLISELAAQHTHAHAHTGGLFTHSMDDDQASTASSSMSDEVQAPLSNVSVGTFDRATDDEKRIYYGSLVQRKDRLKADVENLRQLFDNEAVGGMPVRDVRGTAVLFNMPTTVELQERIDQLQVQVDGLQRDNAQHATEMAALRAQHTADIAALQGRLQSQERQHETDMAALRAQNAALQDRLQTQVRIHAVNMAAIQGRHATDIDALRTQHAADMAAFRGEMMALLQRG